MKILYLANIRLPTEKAHGYQIMTMCGEWAAAGHQVTLLVPQRGVVQAEAIFSFYQRPATFQIKILPTFDFIRYDHLLFYRSFYLQTLWFASKFMFYRLAPGTIVYTREPVLALVASLRGYPAFAEVHSWSRGNQWFSLSSLRRLRGVVTVTTHLKQKLIAGGVNQAKILVAPSGVELKLFDLSLTKVQALEQLPLPSVLKEELAHVSLLLYTGSYRTMEADKGLNDIFLALTHLPTNQPIFFLAVGGSQTDIDYYQSLANRLGVANRVRLLGRFSQPVLAIFQQAADILLMPFPRSTHYEFFMTPLKMFEYMAARRPIIASDLPSLREILDETTCLFVPPGDPPALAQAISSLLRAPAQAKNLAAAARARVAGYQWSARAQNIADFIKQHV